MSELFDDYLVGKRGEMDLVLAGIEELEILLRRALQQLEYHQENFDTRCSHSVGICFCELREVIRAIKEELGDDNNS